jgi:hypothetical protein
MLTQCASLCGRYRRKEPVNLTVGRRCKVRRSLRLVLCKCAHASSLGVASFRRAWLVGNAVFGKRAESAAQRKPVLSRRLGASDKCFKPFPPGTDSLSPQLASNPTKSCLFRKREARALVALSPLWVGRSIGSVRPARFYALALGHRSRRNFAHVRRAYAPLPSSVRRV